MDILPDMIKLCFNLSNYNHKVKMKVHLEDKLL